MRNDPACRCSFLPLACASLAFLAHAGLQSTPENVYQQGKRFFQLSVQTFHQLQETAPESAWALALRGDDLAKKSRYPAALDAYNQALKQMPGLRGLHSAIAEIYLAEGKPADVSKAQAAEQRLGSPNCAVEKLQCDFSSGRFDEVVRAASAKHDAERLYWLARAYRELALRSFSELNTLPESSELHRARAQLFRDEHKYSDSVDEWRAALKLAPGDRSIQRQLAATLYDTENYEVILPELQQLLKAGPDSADLNFYVGDSLLETGQNESAAPYLETALRLDPKMLPAHVALGLCYARMGDPQKAIPHLKAGLALDKNGQLYYVLARAYSKTGQSQLAKAMMDKYQQLRKPR